MQLRLVYWFVGSEIHIDSQTKAFYLNMDDSIQQRSVRDEQQYEGSEFAEIIHPITTNAGTNEMTPMKQMGEAESGSPTICNVDAKPHAWCTCGNQLTEQLP